MVADIASRMAEGNPGIENPLEASGVILIDEIDLHLHPKWQREILRKLHEVFLMCSLLLPLIALLFCKVLLILRKLLCLMVTR